MPLGDTSIHRSRSRSTGVSDARAYIRFLLREGRLDEAEATSQLALIDRAERRGQPVLIVADSDSTLPSRHRRRRAA
jgi:hypothetical protein